MRRDMALLSTGCCLGRGLIDVHESWIEDKTEAKTKTGGKAQLQAGHQRCKKLGAVQYEVRLGCVTHCQIGSCLVEIVFPAVAVGTIGPTVFFSSPDGELCASVNLNL